MNQSNSSKQVLLSVIGVAILVVAVVGVSFAFFNYTRTGTENTVSTGKIDFISTQSGTLALTNVFPITSTQLATESANGYTGNKDYGEVVVTIQGNTTYASGLDYIVSATDVDFTSGSGTGAVTLPVNVEVTPASLGTASTNASLARDTDVATGNTDKIVTNSFTGSTPLASGDVLAKGHIATHTTGDYSATRINGTLTIKCYIDAGKIAITDTLVGADDEPEGYTNGTTGTGTGTWVNGRLQMTTEQWNALTSDALSFKVKVEAIETGGSYVS